MWVAERMSITAMSDEDCAMAYVNFGSFDDRDLARSALLHGIMDEVRYFVDGSPVNFHSYCVIRLAIIHNQLMEDPELNVSDNDGLRFQIAERTRKLT